MTLTMGLTGAISRKAAEDALRANFSDATIVAYSMSASYSLFAQGLSTECVP